MKTVVSSDNSLEKAIDLQAIVAPPERLSEFFHMVNRLIPDEQVVRDVPPEMPAHEALRLMQEHGYSQLPVPVARRAGRQRGTDQQIRARLLQTAAHLPLARFVRRVGAQGDGEKEGSVT